MARPEFWQAEDFSAFTIPKEDDSEYRWVLRDFEWVPAKISAGNSPREFIATISENGDSFECKEEDIFEAIPSIAGLGRLPDDLVHADDMSERSIVHTLSERFYRDDIYTSVGDILIALNPFRPLPLYTPLVMQQYMTSDRAEVLKPHPFDISRRAYNSMLTDGRNQAILISGESGAGKTETTKLCLSYLSEAAGSASGIEQKILSANPILEAFGNAKTLRNNNSSRFGKFMNLSFDLDGVVVGCGTTNYLLEKSRVHKVSAGERSYHIFYQVCTAYCEEMARKSDAGAKMSYHKRQTLRELDSPMFKDSRADLTKLNLGRPEEFHFLTQSQCISIPNVSDAEHFHEMEFACIRLGLTRPELEDAFAVCGAVLHLGNLQFVDNPDGNGGCQIRDTHAVKKALENSSKLLGLPCDEISLRLRTKELVVRGEVSVVQLTSVQAAEARDALCKSMYKNCFDWLVQRTNIAMIDPSLAIINEERGKFRKPQASSRKFIGILDIFGFEIFELNGFEQFCINYANEKLQQHFNQHTFKDELAACERENISFENFHYADNQDVLDLIEMKGGTGILSVMDDECRVPRSNGFTFLNKLVEKHSKHPRFVVAKGEAFKDSFAIDHYAGRVFYKVQEFLEKNKDKMGEDLERVLKQSYLSFEPPKTAEQLREEESEFLNSAKGRAKPKILTLGGQFKLQLDDLVKKLNESAPHFIRCVRPNDSKQPEFFHGVCVHQQLKQSGAFDALGIRKRGFNFQFKHEIFISRYGSLVRDKSNRRISSLGGSISKRDACIEIIRQLSKLPNMENAATNIQVGNSMVFWKANEDRHLSSLRRQEICSQVVSVQKVVRGILTRKHFKQLRDDIDAIDKLMRGVQERRVNDDSTLSNENRNMEDILNAKLRIRKMRIKLPSWEKTIEAESRIANERIEVLNKVESIREIAPKDINEHWLNVVEKARDLKLHSPLTAKLFAIYKDFTEKCAPLLRKCGAVLKDDDVSIPVLQGLIAEIQECRGTVPGFAEKEEAKLQNTLKQLEMENRLMDELLALCAGSVEGTMPSEDYSRQIQDFATTNKSAVGKRVKAALRLVDYMFEVRETMLKTIRRASNDDVTVKPVMPPPPPPKRSSVTGQHPPPPRRESGVPPPPPPPPRAGSTQHPPPPISGVGSVGQADIWSPVEQLFKQYGELVAAVHLVGVDPVIAISGSEIECYKLIVSDCKAIVEEGAAALVARNASQAEHVVSLIQDFNDKFPGRGPYLMASQNRPHDNDRGYGVLIPDVSVTKLFAALLKMLSSRIEALKAEDAVVKTILQVLDKDAIVVAGDLFSPDRPEQPVLHGTAELEAALQAAALCRSSSSGYLYPNTENVIRMAEYVLSLRKLASGLIAKQLSADSSLPSTDDEREAWNDLQKLLSQDKHHDGHIPSKNVLEVDALRKLILDRNATLVDVEKTKEMVDSLRRAIAAEDEGQVKFLLAELNGLSDKQKEMLRRQEEIDSDVACGNRLLDNMATVKMLLAEAADTRPFTAITIENALAKADAFTLKSTSSLNAYVQLRDFLDKLKDCVARAHRAWNNGDINDMISVLDEASENNIEDDEFELVRFLVSKWHEDYGAFLRALIDLNTFLERHAEVEKLNEKLNEYYFSLRPPPPPEPEPVVIDMNALSNTHNVQSPSKLAESLSEFQSKISARSSVRMENIEEAMPSNELIDSELQSEAIVSTVKSSIARFSGRSSVPLLPDTRKRQDSRQIGGNLVREMVKMREQQALLANQSPHIVESKTYVRRHVVPEEVVVEADDEDRGTVHAAAAIDADDYSVGSHAGLDDGSVDIMTVKDDEGDVYIWYRFRHLRRFADPDLEFTRKMFSNEDIPTSVTRIADQSQVRMAVASFKCLLGAMGDQVCNYPQMMVDEFCSIAKKNQTLADEAYCQLVKQLTANPSQASRSKGIAIFRRLVDNVVPSKDLEPYIEHFLRDNGELEILHLLQLRIRSGDASSESGDRKEDRFLNYAGYLTLVKGKLIQVYLKRFCVLNSETMIISMSDDPSSRVDALLVCQIREVRVRKGSDNASKCRFPFELEMKNGSVKVFHAISANERTAWMTAFKAARYQYWVHGGKLK